METSDTADLTSVTPGLQAARQCLFRIGTYMEHVWYSWPKDTSGSWDQDKAPAQTDMGAIQGEDQGSSAGEPGSLRLCMSPPHEDQTAYATGKNGLC